MNLRVQKESHFIKYKICFISLREGRSNWFFKFRVEIGHYLSPEGWGGGGGGKGGGRIRGEGGGKEGGRSGSRGGRNFFVVLQ